MGGDEDRYQRFCRRQLPDSRGPDAAAIGWFRFLPATWDSQHSQSSDDGKNAGARTDGVLDYLLEESWCTPVRSGIIRNIVSREDEPATNLSVMIYEGLDRMNIVSTLLEKEGRELVEVRLPLI